MIQINIHKKGLRVAAVLAIVEAAIKQQYADATVSASRKEPAESRSDRFSEAQSSVSDAKMQAEELMDELQTWRDGLPENLQSSQKADELDEALSSLQEFIDVCDTAESTDVSFPGMY